MNGLRLLQDWDWEREYSGTNSAHKVKIQKASKVVSNQGLFRKIILHGISKKGIMKTHKLISPRGIHDSKEVHRVRIKASKMGALVL